MQTFIIVCLLFCLLCSIGMTTTEWSGDAMKTVVIVSLCTLIYLVWAY